MTVSWNNHKAKLLEVNSGNAELLKLIDERLREVLGQKELENRESVLRQLDDEERLLRGARKPIRESVTAFEQARDTRRSPDFNKSVRYARESLAMHNVARQALGLEPLAPLLDTIEEDASEGSPDKKHDTPVKDRGDDKLPVSGKPEASNADDKVKPNEDTGTTDDSTPAWARAIQDTLNNHTEKCDKRFDDLEARLLSEEHVRVLRAYQPEELKRLLEAGSKVDSELLTQLAALKGVNLQVLVEVANALQNLDPERREELFTIMAEEDPSNLRGAYRAGGWVNRLGKSRRQPASTRTGDAGDHGDSH